MQFCLLSINDAEALLAFELENRHWFEASIEERHESFYQLEAVQEQIQQFLKLYSQSKMYPALVKDNQGNILARANLRVDNNGFDTFGYRVAEKASGQGVATYATKHLLSIAQKNFKLSQVSAFVSVENPASVSVLNKFGFEKNSFHPKLTLVKGSKIDCYEYKLNF